MRLPSSDEFRVLNNANDTLPVLPVKTFCNR